MNNFNGLRSKKTDYERSVKIKEGKDLFSVRLSADERDMLDKAKKILLVDRDSTALKELASIGNAVIHDSHLGKIVQKVIRRIRKGYDKVIETEQENM